MDMLSIACNCADNHIFYGKTVGEWEIQYRICPTAGGPLVATRTLWSVED